jgi:hypothetical protein
MNETNKKLVTITIMTQVVINMLGNNDGALCFFTIFLFDFIICTSIFYYILQMSFHFTRVLFVLFFPYFFLTYNM